MRSFSDNDENRRADSGNPDFEFADLENNAPEFGKEKASGSGVSDFEYGDDSVAGEYDVRESKFFKYGSGAASSDESIRSYYGHETRIDRYSKEDECECYGYETIPEEDYTAATAASASEESAAVSEPEAEPAAKSGEPVYEETEYGQTADEEITFLRDNVKEGDVYYSIGGHEEMQNCIPFYTYLDSKTCELTFVTPLEEAIITAEDTGVTLWISVLDGYSPSEDDVKTLEKYGLKMQKQADFEFDRYKCEMYRVTQ